MRVSQISIYRQQSPYSIKNKNINRQPHYLLNQPIKDVNFKGKKLEFLLDVAVTSAFTAATGFMGAGLSSAYLYHKYVLKKNNNDNK